MTVRDNDWFARDSLGASGSGRPTAHDIATRMLAFNHARLAAFEPYDIVISDIGWDLLLGLFVAQERGQRLSVHALCDDVPVAKTVSVRWLRALRSGGLVDYDDRLEGLSAQVRLTPAAEDVLRALIEG